MFCSQFSFNYLDFKYFSFERTWWMVFQKRVVCTKFYIYLFITRTLSATYVSFSCIIFITSWLSRVSVYSKHPAFFTQCIEFLLSFDSYHNIFFKYSSFTYPFMENNFETKSHLLTLLRRCLHLYYRCLHLYYRWRSNCQ